MIYRYRCISDNSLNALLNDELFVSVPTKFNDPFDSCFSYDIHYVASKLLDGSKYFANLYIYSFYNEYNRKPNDDEIEEAIASFRENKDEIEKFVQEQCFRALTMLRDEYYVGCFSKEIKNTVLWAHYAACGQGFAVGYDDNDVSNLSLKYYKRIRYNRQSCGLYYVDYSPNTINNNSLMIDILDSFALFTAEQIMNPKKKRFRYELTEENIMSIFLHKNTLWRYEEELRIILPNTNLGKPFASIGKIKPRAIYLGANIEKQNKYLIKKICEEKGIQLFQMKLIFENGKQELEYLQIL